jgi:hypothetical protein
MGIRAGYHECGAIVRLLQSPWNMTRRSAWKRTGIRLLLALGVLAVVLVLIDRGLDEPLRRRMEKMMNARLQGYSVTIGRLDLHLWGGSLDLYGMKVAQSAFPEPPIADFARLTASVQWSALLRGRVVADIELDHPMLRVDLRQLGAESSDETPVEDRGWQGAVEAIYPFKINELIVDDGELVYVDKDPERPLVLHRVAFQADNIRNIVSPDRTYPSEVMLRATVFDHGSLSLDGAADFLAEPHVGLRAHVDIQDVDLSFISPVLERFGMIAKQGTFGVRGDLEYGPRESSVIVDEMVIRGTQIDYLYKSAAEPKQEEAAQAVAKAAGEANDAPELVTRLNVLRIHDSTLRITNKAERPAYTIFWNHIDLVAENISNQPEDGEAVARLTARFMGSGPMRADMTFLPSSESPDFRVALGIEDTDMRSLNDLFRAHGKFDVVAGRFSFFSEVRVHAGRIEGYVKPLFHGVDVFDPAQDAREGFWHKTWERVVGVASKILKNKKREEVATQMDISGSVENPRASTLQVVLNLVRNAFVKSILPGFEREAGQKRQTPRKKERRKDDRTSGIILEEFSEAESRSGI